MHADERRGTRTMGGRCMLAEISGRALADLLVIGEWRALGRGHIPAADTETQGSVA